MTSTRILGRFGLLALVLAPGVVHANPLEGLESSTLDKLKKQASSGLNLLDDIYTPPSFSGVEGVVRFWQTVDAEVQYALAGQQPPASQIGGQASESTNDWKIGDGWFSAGLNYRTKGDNTGFTFNYAGMYMTVLGQSQNLTGMAVTTTRGYGIPDRVDDDLLHYVAESYFLGNTTKIAEGSLATGQRYDPGYNLQSGLKIFEQTWRYAVGPVPIRITAGLQGNLTTSWPYAEFGLHDTELSAIQYRAFGRAWAAMTAYVAADIFGDVPSHIRPGDLEAKGSVNLIEGAIQADARGSSLGKGPCLAAYVDEAKVLSANVYIRAWWQSLKTVQVESFVKTVCDNPWGIPIPGCEEAKKVVTTINQWTSFDHREDIFSHPGFTFADDWTWVDQRGCEEDLPDTRLELCNDHDETVFAIFGAPNRVSGGWYSQGWEELPTYACTVVDLGYQLGPNLRLYAEDGQGKTWEGDAGRLCVKEYEPDNPFGMDDADTVACDGDNEKRVKTFLLPITPHTTTTYTFY